MTVDINLVNHERIEAGRREFSRSQMRKAAMEKRGGGDLTTFLILYEGTKAFESDYPIPPQKPRPHKKHPLTAEEKYQIALERHRERVAAGSISSEQMYDFLLDTWRYFKSGWHYSHLQKTLEKVYGEVPEWHGRADDNIEGLA